MRFLMVIDDKNNLNNLRSRYKDMIICPRLDSEVFREFLIKRYQLSSASTEDLGLHDLYDDYFAWVYNQRMKPYCEWAGISCNPDSLHFELFESHIPVHHAGFLFNPVGHKANFGMTHVVLEDSTGFVYSNDQMICIESMYARGIDPDDIEDLSLFGRRYLENLQYLQEGVFESFKEIMNKDFNRLVSGIPK